MKRKLSGYWAVIGAAIIIASGAYVGAAIAATHAESSTEPGMLEVATFAGGCFWCVESDFDNVPGVVRTISGYTGGRVENPSYKQVSSEKTGHREAVQIHFDPKRTSYADLLEVLWRSVDPTDAGGQFCDRGESYTTAIFVNSETQRQLAEGSKQSLEQSGVLQHPIVTTIETAGPFYSAEDYHQDYYKKNPVSYRFYRFGCGRDARIKKIWGDEAHRGITKH